MSVWNGLRIGLMIASMGVCCAQNSTEADVRRGRELQADFERDRQRASQATSDFLAEQVVESEQQLKLLKERYNSSHPDVRRAEERLADIRKKLPPARQERSSKPESLRLSERSDLGWWTHPGIAQYLGITAEQGRRIDDVFRQYRLRMVDLNAALEKEELMLEPLVAADVIDEAKVTAKLDRVAQARAELEKAAGRMLLGIRKVLTPEQWKKRVQMQSDSARGGR